MSAIASGIGTVFKAVGSTAAKISSSVVGIGKAAFTAGAATSAGSMASGGLNGVIQSVTGGGVLGNVLTGAVKQAVVGAGLGAVTGALTGAGAGKGALFGAAGGALTGGFGELLNQGALPTGGSTPAVTPTGYAPTGQTGWKDPTQLAIADPAVAAAPATPATAAPASTGLGAGLKGLMDNELLMGALGGLGEGMMKKMEVDALREERGAERAWHDARDRRITDSYNVSPDAHQSQHKAAKSNPRKQGGFPFFNYNSQTGELEAIA
ncbi:hypothetical protein [Roseibium sp.]|uniref:hypothetical protein n=1 Tax=Roseibium sp. TaxID=1936156 RepID=UPI003B529A5E